MKLYDAQGNLLARSQEVEVPPGQFRTFDFNRDALSAAGEPGTGRLQVRADIGIRLISLDGSKTYFPTSMEGADNRTGGNYFTGSVTVSDD